MYTNITNNAVNTQQVRRFDGQTLFGSRRDATLAADTSEYSGGTRCSENS